MGRLLKRVPMDFNWPLKMIWKGYFRPYRPQRCEACDGSGSNPQMKQLSDDWYDFNGTGRKWRDAITQDEVDALVKRGRLRDFGDSPTAEQVNRWEKTNSFGHDAVNQWICVETRAKRLGIDTSPCKYCGGEGEIWHTPEIGAMAEAWKRYDPPTGDGYQLWEDTTEGSPVSPVFATLDELCKWAAKNATTFGAAKASEKQWRKMLDDGHVCHKVGNMIFM